MLPVSALLLFVAAEIPRPAIASAPVRARIVEGAVVTLRAPGWDDRQRVNRRIGQQDRTEVDRRLIEFE